MVCPIPYGNHNYNNYYYHYYLSCIKQNSNYSEQTPTMFTLLSLQQSHCNLQHLLCGLVHYNAHNTITITISPLFLMAIFHVTWNVGQPIPPRVLVFLLQLFKKHFGTDFFTDRRSLNSLIFWRYTNQIIIIIISSCHPVFWYRLTRVVPDKGT